jgi:hypothetical protein
MRDKQMPIDEFQGVMGLDWGPVRLTALFSCLGRIPSGIVHSIYASGTFNYGTGHCGGVEVFRRSPDDPVELNKDVYEVYPPTGESSELIVRGPYKDTEHWLDEIPERHRGAPIFSAR